MKCALCDRDGVRLGIDPMPPLSGVLLGGHVVCAFCRTDVTAELLDPQFPDDWPSDERVAASVQRRVANRRASAALELQGALL